MLSTDVDDGVGVFDPNMENVFEAIPLRLLFMKFAVACDDDENNDDVADEVVVVGAEKFLLAVGVGVTVTLADIVVMAVVNPLVKVVVALIMLLLLIVLAFGSTDVVIDLLTNGGGIVLYCVDVWSAYVGYCCSAIDVVNRLVLSPP